MPNLQKFYSPCLSAGLPPIAFLDFEKEQSEAAMNFERKSRFSDLDKEEAFRQLRTVEDDQIVAAVDFEMKIPSCPAHSDAFQFNDLQIPEYVLPMPAMYMQVPVSEAKEAEKRSKVKSDTNTKQPAGKKKNLQTLNANPELVDNITTLMVRNIPCSISQETLISLLDSNGLMGKYDFVYLPRAGNNTSKSSNLGYAFINLVDHKSAELCAARFNGTALHARSLKVCRVTPAEIQGVAKLKKHFSKTAVIRGSRGPIFIKDDLKKKEDSDESNPKKILNKENFFF